MTHCSGAYNDPLCPGVMANYEWTLIRLIRAKHVGRRAEVTGNCEDCVQGRRAGFRHIHCQTCGEETSTTDRHTTRSCPK